MGVVSGRIAAFEQPPFSADGWRPTANFGVQLTFATPRSGSTIVGTMSDPDGDNRGSIWFETSPFSASGWQAIAQPAGSLALTSPAGGGTTATVIDKNTKIAYFMDTPFSASNWHAISNDVAELAITSPRSGGEVIAAINATAHSVGFMTTPFSASGWLPIGSDVKHVVMSRAGNGAARIGVIKNDGSVWVQTYPITSEGWQQVAPASWNVSKLAMSGDTIGVIREAAGGNHIAAFQHEPFSIDGWHDVANDATEITFDEKGL
jgi:hypothetical protein